MTTKIVSTLHKAEEAALALLLGGMVLVTFSQVIARYVFNSGVIWALELTTYMFAWLVIFGISYGIRVRCHIGVDALVKLLPSGGRRTCSIITVVLGIVYAGLLLYGAWDHVIGIVYTYEIESEDLKVPLWIPQSVLIWGFALMIWRLLVLGYKLITGQEESGMLGDEGQEALEAHGGFEPDEKNQTTKGKPK